MLIVSFLNFSFDLFLVKQVLMNPKGSLRDKLEEIFKLMLVLWCRQSEVNRLVAAEPCGKTMLLFYLLKI